MSRAPARLSLRKSRAQSFDPCFWYCVVVVVGVGIGFGAFEIALLIFNATTLAQGRKRKKEGILARKGNVPLKNLSSRFVVQFPLPFPTMAGNATDFFAWKPIVERLPPTQTPSLAANQSGSLEPRSVDSPNKRFQNDARCSPSRSSVAPPTRVYPALSIEGLKTVALSNASCLAAIGMRLSRDGWQKMENVCPSWMAKPMGNARKLLQPIWHRRDLDTLSPTQRHTYQAAVQDRKSLFITGSAGNGKSYVIKTIVEGLRLQGLEVQVTATTGSAALNLNLCASTLHSFAGIQLGDKTVDFYLSNSRRRKELEQVWTQTDVLVIDEVSMLDPLYWQKLGEIARYLRVGKKGVNSRDNGNVHCSPSSGSPLGPRKALNEGFGGLQVILIGDFFQLPPVRKRSEHQAGSIEFAFETPLWKTAIDESIVLSECHRQKDMEFVDFLNRVRVGRLTPSDHAILRTLVVMTHHKQSVAADKGPSQARAQQGILTRLRSMRADVDSINRKYLEQLPGEAQHFNMRSGVVPDSGNGNRSLPDYAEDRIQKLCNQAPADELLSLKVGAQVVLILNLNLERGLANGSTGKVVRFVMEKEAPNLHTRMGRYLQRQVANKQRRPAQELCPEIEFSNGQVVVIRRHMWESHIRGIGDVYIEQLPLLLSHAITLHRCQGMTLDRVELELDDRIFEPGQAYVALSRVKEMMSLELLAFTDKAIRAHPKVVQFYDRLESENRKART